MGRTKLSIRFFGDDLVPSELSALLGAEPTKSALKDEIRKSKTREWREKTGKWLIHANERGPGDLDGQLNELFSKLTDDIEIWRQLTTRFDADCFCGLFMRESNEGFNLQPETLKALAARGLGIGFDIYDPVED